MKHESKLDLDTIRSVFSEIMDNKPQELPEIKCGKIFKQALVDNCKDVLVKDIPFASGVINPTIFGMKVVVDETLPDNVARIGDVFINLTK